jgi:hypothetical protein
MLGVRAMCRNSKPVWGASALNSKTTLLLTSSYEELLAIIGRPSDIDPTKLDAPEGAARRRPPPQMSFPDFLFSLL